MITIRVVGNDKEKIYTVDESIQLDRLLKLIGCHHDMPCSGNHTCGKCRIRIVGDLSPISPAENQLLRAGDIEQDIRLACFVEVLGDSTLYIENEITSIVTSIEKKYEVNSTGGYGLAIDLGTTTIVMQLYDMSSGTLLIEKAERNNQTAFGADVISRIQYATENSTDVLKDILHKQLNDMARKSINEAQIEIISKVVLTGNTVMLHFFEGLDASGIAVAPFTPNSLFGESSKVEIAGCAPYLPTCIGAYIGADITTAIMSTAMYSIDDKTILLADLGTNGELVLSHKGRLYCASTALGPAFEGATIRHGMRASEGAIAQVSRDKDALKIMTIGDKPAIGICGSGIVDLIDLMLRTEIIDETGRIDKAYEGLGKIVESDDGVAWKIPTTEITVTQKDIRQVQLAKSAVYAGIKTLLEEVQVPLDAIDEFYVAGGFGYFMNTYNAEHIGLFPEGLGKKVKLIGNGALSGAISLLMNDAEIKNERAIISKAEEIHLSGKKTFSDYYIDGMLFGED